MVEDQMNQLRIFISSLTERTREGMVKWTWDQDERTATAILANGRIIVGRDRDFDTRILIQDSDANSLEDVNVGYTAYSDLKTEADGLYELARRSALKVDSKLESMMREISS